MSADTQSNFTPRLGALQWVAPSLLAATGLVIGLVSDPVFYSPSRTRFSPAVPFGAIMMLYGPLLAALLAATIAAFRLLVLTSHRAEFGALISLGATRRDLVAPHVRRGLADGAAGGLLGVLVGGAINQTAGGWSADFQWAGVWPLLTAVVVTTVSGGAAYAIATAAVLRGVGPRAVAASAVAPSSAPAAASAAGPEASSTPVKPRHSRAKRVALIATAPVVAAVLSVSAGLFGLNNPWYIYPLFVAFAAATVEAVVGLTWLGARIALGVSHLAARAYARAGASGRIAADSLRRPAPGRIPALAGIVLIVAASSGVGILINGLQARNTLSGDLMPTLIVTSVDVPSILGGEPRQGPLFDGWEDKPLPEGLKQELSATPGVVVVPAALLGAEVTQSSSSVVGYSTFLAVDPADLDRIADASGGLFLRGSTTWRASGGPQLVRAGSTKVTARGVSGPAPFAAVDRAWAEEQFGAAPTSALIVYLRDDIKVDDFLGAHDLREFHVAVSYPATDRYPPLSRVGYGLATGVPLVIAVGLVIVFAITSQRLRGHDTATLSALGARRRDLALAVGLEVGTLTAAAGAAGAVGGALVGEVISLYTYQVGLQSWPAGLGFNLVHAPTATLAAVVAIATLVAATAAGWMQLARSRRSPVEQLREAIKEGSL
jgi:hypothetical protein